MDDKIKVLIASVLKPADDVRSCFKIGQSLAQTNKYEVNIIGFDSKKKVEQRNIFLHPIFNFKRNSIKRLRAPFSILKKYLQLKPQIIIVNAPELLWVISLIKILFGPKIIYDIRENYKYNIKQNNIYKGIRKYTALVFIDINERLAKLFTDGIFLAEDIYEKQLHFIHTKPYIKLLNKTTLAIKHATKPIEHLSSQPLRFVYSGTIGEEYGTLDAINLCTQLQVSNQNITLTIIGYSPDFKYFKKIKDLSRKYSFIHLITSNKPIPYAEIIHEIEKSDIALLPYQLNPNLSDRFPTKIYDYLALKIPMIIPKNPLWENYIRQYAAGISVDFVNPNIKELLQKLRNTEFYNKQVGDGIHWKGQESDLLAFMTKILSK